MTDHEMLLRFLFVMVTIVALAVLAGEFFSASWDSGFRAGFDEGLADGIRLANEVSLEDEKIIHCIECKWQGQPGCALSIIDESDEPKDHDFCSFAERRES